MIDWTILRKKFGSVESAARFEAIALAYVRDTYPNFTWEPTSTRGDGNRDAYAAQDGEYEIWEEAKYRNGIKGDSHKKDRALERKDVDSTVLSGLMYGKVRLIIFISNADMPSEVMMRSMFGARIRGIEVTCVLSSQLEDWLSKHKKFYREQFEEPFPRQKSLEHVMLFNKAQFFDLISTDFGALQKRRDFFVGERSLLELVIYSSRPIDAQIKELSYPFIILDEPNSAGKKTISLEAGLSNLSLLVQMTEPCTKKVTICVELDGKAFYQESNWISVHRASRFPLAYGMQLKTIANLRLMLQTAAQYEQGKIVSLYAGSSMGKSYVLQKLMEEFCLQYDITLITFESNRDSLSNYMLLCKTVLFLSYGNIFWDIVSTSPSKINAFKAQVLASDRGELFSKDLLSKLVDGCFNANIAFEVVETLLKESRRKNIILIRGQRLKSPRILLLDDIQYLNKTQNDFMYLLFEQLRSCSNSNLLVASATKGKFCAQKAESLFLQLTPNRFELNGLSTSDKRETLKSNFGLSAVSANSFADTILPDSPLLAEEVLKNISANITGNINPEAIILSYTRLVDDSIVLQDKFFDCKPQFYLLDIIYKFKKGIPIKLIASYPQFDVKAVNRDIKKLVAQNLIVLQDRIAKPYHDFYIAAYRTLRGDKEYNLTLGKFFKYLLNREDLAAALDCNQVLAMLLRCGKRYATAYKARVKEYILEYVHTTQFGAAIQFCEYYYDQIAPIGTKSLTHEESYILYLYADCLVHCDHLGRAHERLQEVYQFAPDDSLEKYEAGASLLNQLFWEIKPDKVIADSFEIQAGAEQILQAKLSDEDRHRITRAYDSSLNRRMAAYLLADQPDRAHDVYCTRLKEIAMTDNTCFPSGAATLIMDYARGISYWNPNEGYRLMRLACNCFKTAPKSHYRRILLCEIDLAVLNSVVYKQYSPNRFIEIKEKLIDGGFISEYFKAVLKHAACKLISQANLLGDCGFPGDAQIFCDIESELQQALLETQLQPRNRELVLCNYIKSFIAACRNQHEESISLLNASMDILKSAGASYQNVLQHNMENIKTVKTIAWGTSQSVKASNVFLVDCRFW